jgi:hypothetical protein
VGVEPSELLTPAEVEFTFAEVGVLLPLLVAAMVADRRCWAVVVWLTERPFRYVQLGLPGNEAAIVEAVADTYLDPGEELSDYERRALSHLGWPPAEVDRNHQLLPGFPLSAYDLACRMLATVQLAFGCTPDTCCSMRLVKWHCERPAA